MWKQVEGGPVGMDLNSIFLEHRWKQPSIKQKHSFEFHLHLKLAQDPELQILHP